VQENGPRSTNIEKNAYLQTQAHCSGVRFLTATPRTSEIRIGSDGHKNVGRK
jgi:hypothetical protein